MFKSFYENSKIDQMKGSVRMWYDKQMLVQKKHLEVLQNFANVNSFTDSMHVIMSTIMN